MKYINVEIDSDGLVKMEGVGFKGTACDAAMKALEDSLGKQTSRVNKPEYTATGTVSSQQKVGGVKTVTLHITPEGIVQCIDDGTIELLADSLGTLDRRRASHVWPVHPLKRLAFRALRSPFGERGRVAGWCRTWRGPWEVRFAEDLRKAVFTHHNRADCIAWEIQTINERLAS